MKWRSALPLLLILCATSICYLATLDYPFVWHDTFLIGEGGYVAKSPGDVARLFTRGMFQLHEEEGYRGSYFRPLVGISYSLDHMLYGDNPTGYHVTNLILHLANVTVLFLLLGYLVGSGTARWSTTLIFALHPIQTESVTFITNRVELLPSLFVLTSLWCYLHSRLRDESSPSGGRRLYAAALVLGGLGLLAKESAAALPLLVVMMDLIFFYPGRLTIFLKEKASLRRGGFFFVLGGYLLYRRLALGHLLAGDSPPAIPGGFGPTILTMVGIVGDYLRLLILPVGQSISDAFPVIRSPGSSLFLLSLAGVLLWLGLGIRLARREKRITLGTFWFLLGLLPVSNLVPLMHARYEHFLYLPSAGFAMVLAVALERFSGIGRRWTPRAAVTAVVLIGLLYGAATIARNRTWESQERLFREAVQGSPGFREGHYYVGKHYFDRGEFRRAEGHFRVALQQNPDNTAQVGVKYPLFYQATCQAHLGRLEESERGFRLLIQQGHGSAATHRNLGNVLGQEGKFAEAVTELSLSLELDPDHVETRFLLAQILESQGDSESALAHLEELLSHSPNHAKALALRDTIRARMTAPSATAPSDK